ncbi:MAG: hypothetical protein ACPLRO_02070, partial [Candidatus Kapaibacteriota bacterium]
MKKFCILFAFIPTILFSQSIFRKPFNDSTYKDWANYITTYAPSDSAWRVFNYLINSHLNTNRGLKAYKIWKDFAEFFPNNKEILQRHLNNIKEIAIYPTPKEEDYSILEEF